MSIDSALLHRVLVVDDDPSLRRIIGAVLARADYRVDSVGTLWEALDACANGDYHAILIDQELPDGDGLDLIRHLANQGRLPASIMLTGSGDEQTAVEAIKLGMRDYVSKNLAGGVAKLLPGLIARAIEEQTRAEAALRLAQENARLQEARTNSLLLLGQMANASVDEIANFALEQGVALTSSAMGYLAFLNDAETILTMQAWSRSAMELCAVQDKPIRYPLEATGLWGEAVRQRRPVITNDYAAPSLLKRGVPPGHVPIVRHMNVPVFDGERIVAVAGVANKASDYDESDVQQLTLLMEAMWRLLHRTRLEEELRRYRDRLESMVGDRTAELAGKARELALVNADLKAEIAQRATVERALADRVKEMDCLLAISALLNESPNGDETWPQRLVERVPDGFHNAQQTVARIVLDGRAYTVPDFEETPARLTAEIVAHGEQVGSLEVHCRSTDAATAGEAFLNEERALLAEIAERIGRVIERKRAEAEVRSLTRQIEFVLGATRTGLSIVDADYSLIYVDPYRRKAYQDTSGRKCDDYFTFDGNRDNSRVRRALMAQKPIVEEDCVRRDNQRPVQVTCIPFQDEQGQWLVAEVEVDLSERKRMERELAQAQRLEAIGHLAAGIAHEINTPTQYIGDNLQFLQEAFQAIQTTFQGVSDLSARLAAGDLPAGGFAAALQGLYSETDSEFYLEEGPTAIEQSIDGVGRVASIVRAMKEFSHPGDAEWKPVDLNRAVSSTLTISRSEWKYVADLDLDLDPTLPLVDCALGEINQAVLNIVVNAAHAIGELVKRGDCERGKISVRTRHDAEWAVIEIEDTGIGIPETIRAQIFDPFFTTKAVGQGTGQGLSIVHGVIVHKHHGRIDVHSTPGKGTVFSLCLPLRRKDAPVETGDIAAVGAAE